MRLNQFLLQMVTAGNWKGEVGGGVSRGQVGIRYGIVGVLVNNQDSITCCRLNQGLDLRPGACHVR